MDSYSLEAVLSLKEIGYMKKMALAIEQAEELEKQSEQTGKSMTHSFTAASVAANAITKAFSAITKSIGSAVNRFDAISNFPKVMESLGFESGVAKDKIDYLADVTDALPTTLNEIVQSTQTLTASLGDLEKGTDTAVALNDMFLAGGQGAEAAGRAMTQYNQILAKGKVDQQSWNTLVEVAPGQMKQLAQSLLGASAGQKDLYEAIQAGTISIDDMNDAVIRLDNEAGDGFASFHDQAIAATKGIGTAWVNLQNAVVKGTADIIEKMNEASKNAGLPGFADAIDIARSHISKFFEMVANGAGTFVSALAPAAKLVAKNFELIVKISAEVVAGIEAMKVVKKLSSWLDSTKSSISKAKDALGKYKKAMSTYGDAVSAAATAEKRKQEAIKLASEAEKAAQNVMKSRAALEKAEIASAKALSAANKESAKNTELSALADQKAAEELKARARYEAACAVSTEAQAKASAAATAATEAETAAATLSNGQITVKTALLGYLSGEYTLVEAGQLAWNAAMNANPIGILITGATALIGAMTLLSDHFDKTSEAEKKAAEEEKEFHKACEDSVASVEKTADELKRNSDAAKENSKKISNLVSRYKELSEQEDLSTEEKEELKGVIEQLNNSVDGLNIAYDKELKNLSHTAEEVEKKAKAYNKLKEAEAVQEGLNTLIEQEKTDTENLLRAKEDLANAQSVLADKQKEYNDALEQGNTNALYYLSAVEEAEAAVAKCQASVDSETEALAKNAEEQQKYAQQVATASQEASQAEQEATDATVEALSRAIVEKRTILEEAIKNHSVTLDMLSEKNQETVQTLQGIWDGYYESATNVFSALSDEIEIDGQKMIENLQQNGDVIKRFGENMQTIRDNIEQLHVSEPVKTALEEMLDRFQQAGPEQAGAVAAIAQMDGDALAQMGKLLNQNGEEAFKAMGAGMETGAQENLETVKHLVTDIGTTISDTLKETDWTEMSEDCIQGLANGFEADETVVKAAKKAAEDTWKSTHDELELGSPSKKYERFGKWSNEGLANGLRASTNMPVSAAQTVALRVLQETKNRLQNMRDIGVQAVSMLANGIRSAQGTAYSAAYSTGSYTGQGFANGIESQRGSVMATAQSIANAATATLAAAVKQGSPSKVTRKTGYWTGLGFALGIEDEIPLVERIVKKMGEIAGSISVPDFSGVATGNWNASLAIAGGNISYSMDSMRDEIEGLKNAIYAQPIQVSTSLDIDGRVAGRALATHVKRENDYDTLVNNALMGVR